MTVPKWLVPALAIVAALAVGVAATLLGRALAAPDAVVVASGTAVVPVLAPVPDASGGSTTGGLPASETVAEREIALPASDPDAIDPALTELIGALAEAADPVFTLMELDAEADGEAAGGDPCALREGAPGEDCPDGLRSTVLATTSVVDFRAGGQAFPPTHAQFLEHGNPTGGSIFCDGLEPASDEVPFGIVSTAPGTFAVRYWPSARPGDALVVEGITSSASDVAGFEQALADGVDPFSVIGMPRHCLTLHGIEPDTVYTAVVSGVDVLDRVAEPHTLRFSSAGAPVRPGAQIATMGDNLVFVAAPHTREQSAEARVLLVDDDAASPSCAIPASGARSLSPLTDAETEIDADTLAELNIRADHTRKRVQTFVLPEGSTALVCVRWYPAGSAPSWQREQPVFESSAMLQSPDRVLPSARVDAIRDHPAALDAIAIGFASAEGTPCGITVSWRPGGELTLPVELCGPGSLRSGGVRSTGERLWDVGFSGDLVATFTPRLDGAETAPTRVLLPARDGGCRGTCPVPARDRYVVALDGAGTVELSVGWEQGASNGRASWNVTPTVDVAPEYVRPELPQLDLDARWTVADPGTRSWASASFPLTVDRDVDYTMRLTTGTAGVAAPGCGSPDAVLEVSGSARAGTGAGAAHPVTVSGLCAGEVYRAELELTDGDGDRVVWGFADRDAWWSGGLVSAPGVEVTISYSLHAQGYTHSSLSVARIGVGHAGVDLTRTLDACDADGVIQASGTFEGTVAAVNDVVLTLRLQNSGDWSPESCSGDLDGELASTVLVRVPLDELLAGGVEITAPEPFRATLRLSARPAGG